MRSRLLLLIFMASCGQGNSGVPVWNPDEPDAKQDFAVQPADTTEMPDPGADPLVSEEATSAPEPVSSEVLEAVEEEVAEGLCIPNCEDNECGPDGCGSICGFCTWGKVCKANHCVEVCVPACEGKKCGPDGCGGSCGECAANEYCGMDYSCYLKGCTPKCAGKKCGSDGCGGQCGQCGPDEFCTETGECALDKSCHDVTAQGRCVGNELQWCDTSSGDGVLKKQVCDPADGLLCGWDSMAKKYACVKPEQCTPDCEGKECGPDGCSGQCGACKGGEVCSESGHCGEPCGEVTAKGVCEGDTLRFCHKGILITYDCAAVGKTCKLDPVSNTYDCL